MNGPAHYREAERLLAGRTYPASAEDGLPERHYGPDDREIAEAQVHATLALAAATASNIRRNGAVENARFEGGNPVAEEWFKTIGGDG